MLTIDKLIQVLMTEETDDAGMRAVVRALRDEWFPPSEPPHTITVEERWFLNRLNEILGEAGNEKVADSGGAFEGLMDGLAKACATDPAPAVCVWTQKKDAPGFCSTPHGIAYRGVPFPECPSCGKPIQFTEAK